MTTSDIINYCKRYRWLDWDTTLLASIDVETTGLSPWADCIIQVAVILQTGQSRDSWARLVDPGRKLPKRITNITGLQDQDLVGRSYFGTAIAHAPDIYGALRVACNADFDAAFLVFEMYRYGGYATSPSWLDPVAMWLDVQLLARALDGADRRAKGYRLVEMAEKFKLTWQGNAHTALADADMALQVLAALRERHPDQLATPEDALILQRLYMNEA